MCSTNPPPHPGKRFPSSAAAQIPQALNFLSIATLGGIWVAHLITCSALMSSNVCDVFKLCSFFSSSFDKWFSVTPVEFVWCISDERSQVFCKLSCHLSCNFAVFLFITYSLIICSIFSLGLYADVFCYLFKLSDALFSAVTCLKCT